MMRTFEERKKEVLRRSARRIEKRRKRRKALLKSGLCLMCLLCVGLLLPDGLFMSQNQTAMDTAAANNAAANDVAYDDAAKENATDEDALCDCAPVDDALVADYHGENTVASVGGSDYAGVSLELLRVDPEALTIDVVWRNETDQEVSFGEPYDIQRWEDGRWISCATRVLDWPIPAYELAPASGETPITYTTNMNWFDLSQPGRYRITAQFRVDTDDATYTLWAEFELS